MRITLFEKLTVWRQLQCRKHGLAVNEFEYAETEVNKMDNVELVHQLDEHLEEFRKEILKTAGVKIK